MNNTLYVSKNVLIDILGPGALSLAMFMANGSQKGTAFRILFENADTINLTSDFVQNTIIPMLLSENALTQTEVNKIAAYISQSIN